MTTLQKTDIARALGQSFIDNIYLQKSEYYFGLGRCQPWDEELNPPEAIDSIQGEKTTRRDTIFFKKMDGTAASFIIPRINYSQGVVYDMFDDSISMEGKLYYVMTSDFNVYKCLDNNLGGASTEEPYGASTEPIRLSDGYVWKFVYFISPSLREKFLTDNYIPVYNAITESYYSRGTITSMFINSGGLGYSTEGTQIIVNGDGYLKDNPYQLQIFSVYNPGAGYDSEPVVEVQDTVNAVTYVPNIGLIRGQYVKVSDSSGVRIYKAENGGNLGPTPPTHYYSTELSGTVQLKHFQTKPVLESEIDISAVGSVIILDGGFGYTTPPTSTKVGPGSGCVLSTETTGGIITNIKVSSTGTGYDTDEVVVESPFLDEPLPGTTQVELGEVYYADASGERYFYEVTTAGITGNSVPTHTSGSATSGTAVLSVVGKRATAKAVLGVVSNITAFMDVQEIQILNGGIGYGLDTTVEITGGDPDFPALANPVISDDGRITSIIVTYPGHKYSSVPDVIISGTGSNASAKAITQYGYGYSGITQLDIFDPTNIEEGTRAQGSVTGVKTEAKIEPIVLDGIIRGVKVIDGGVGYTTATITVSGSGTGAELTAILGSGELSTIQTTSELLSTPNTVSSVIVTDPGFNLRDLSYTVEGDGTGLELEMVLDRFTLKKINVTNPGRDYTYCNIVFSVYGEDYTLPQARVILSPSNGHGSNPLKELYGKSISLYGTVVVDSNNGFPIDNDFRQISIYGDPLTYGKKQLVNSKTASSCFNIKADSSLVPLEKNSVLKAPSGALYRVVDFTEGNVLLQQLTSGQLNIEDMLVLSINNIDYSIEVGEITNPTLDKYSGNLLFSDNLEPFRPTDNQLITINTIINLI